MTATLPDGSEIDVTLRSACTIYRTSNPNVLTVGPDGLATAVGAGVASVTVSNVGITAVTRIAVSFGDLRTTVQGFIFLDDGSPFEGAQVTILELPGKAISLPDGAFTMLNVAAELGPFTVFAEASKGEENLCGLVFIEEPVPDGITDAGIINITNEIMWTSPTDGLWQDGEHWDVGFPPGEGYNAIIDVPDVDITVRYSPGGTTSINSLVSNEALWLSFGELRIEETSELNAELILRSGHLSGAGALTINGLLTWAGGRMDGGGRTIANGGIEITGARMYDRIIDNTSEAVWREGAFTVTPRTENGAVFNNLPQATFEVQGDLALRSSFQRPLVFNNEGLFMKSVGTGEAEIQAVMNNSGTVALHAGTLSLRVGGTSSGSFVADPGTVLNFGGDHVFEPGSSISGDTIRFVPGLRGNRDVDLRGTYEATTSTEIRANIAFNADSNVISFGDILIIGDLGRATFGTGFTLPDDLQEFRLSEGGELLGDGDLRIGVPLIWAGGGMSGRGRTIADGGIALYGATISGRTIDNSAITTWFEGDLTLLGDAVFNNLAGATFDIAGDFLYVQARTFRLTFNNIGMFMNTGTGRTNFLAELNNSGTVEVRSGALFLWFGGTHSGSFRGSKGTDLDLLDPTHLRKEYQLLAILWDLTTQYFMARTST